ncbi:MAG TPA: sugar phosphate isomerase/epimerase [Ktedonobacterales bacterium]|nr:sugar phosphate isomerase/epimerase [Ktedonobacterales bacterium]
MKLAYSTLACPNWTFEQCVEAAQRHGYAGLELRLMDGEIISSALTGAQRQRMRAGAALAGLSIIGLDTSVRIAQTEAQTRSEQIREGLALLELAHDLETPFMRVFGDPPSGATEAEAVASAVATLEPLARRGRELGVALALETHDAFSSSALVAQVISQVNDPMVGALWDFLHPYRLGETAQETARRLQGHLLHIHVKDGQRPQHQQDDWKLMLLGDGDVPTLAMLRALQAIGYDGWLSVEWEKKWHPELAEPEVALPQYAAALHAYLSALSSFPQEEQSS